MIAYLVEFKLNNPVCLPTERNKLAEPFFDIFKTYFPGRNHLAL